MIKTDNGIRTGWLENEYRSKWVNSLFGVKIAFGVKILKIGEIGGAWRFGSLISKTPGTVKLLVMPRPSATIGEGNGTPLQYSCLEIPWTEEPGRLQSMGLLRVGHD